MAAGREPRGELPALTGGIVEAVEAARVDAVGAECQKLLATLRARCPELALDRRLTAGQVGPEVPLDPERGPPLYRLVARQAAGLPAEGTDAGVVVWSRGDDELAVLVNEVEVTTAEGAIAVAVPVRCDQVGQATVEVRFAVGSEARPSGMVASAAERPLGPPEVVDVWGEALTAFAWQVVLSTAARLADATGRDADGAGLIPAALQASERGIAVLTMARHSFDRPAGA
jgi:hypothetical protein